MSPGGVTCAVWCVVSGASVEASLSLDEALCAVSLLCNPSGPLRRLALLSF